MNAPFLSTRALCIYANFSIFIRSQILFDMNETYSLDAAQQDILTNTHSPRNILQPADNLFVVCITQNARAI